MKGKWGFIIFVAAVVGILLVYTFTGKEYPAIPSDDLHRGVTDTAGCMGCHGQGKKYEMKKTHPPKFECFKCHKPVQKT